MPKKRRSSWRYGIQHHGCQAADCSACDERTRCTKRQAGRPVETNPYEHLLGPAKVQRWEPVSLDRYRQRARAERKVAQVMRRIKGIPWRGIVNVNTWLDLCIAAIRPDRAGRLGLIG